MQSSSRTFNSFQILKNITSNSILFFLEALISLWYTPFLLRQLGGQLFSFIPLARSVTNYFSIITHSLDISTGRHITIELEKGNIKQANQTFNTNLIVTLLLISAVIPIGAVLVLLAPKIFIIPEGMERNVQILFAAIITAFLLGTYQMNYSLAIFAKNRFDLGNLIAVGGRITQILIIVSLFTLKHPSLIFVSLGILGAALINLVGDYYLWRKLLPDLRILWKDFRIRKFKLLLHTGVWAFLYQSSFILFLNVDMIIANRMLDLSLVGVYGALLVIPKNLRILSRTIGGVWGPSILAKYSQSDNLGIDKIVYSSIKLTGLALSLVIGLICGLANPFLGIWIGPETKNMTMILVIMVFPLSTNLIAGSFFYVHVSHNKLKAPAILSFSLSLLNLLLLIYLAPRYGLMGIVIVGALTLTLNDSVFAPIYAARIMRLSWSHYLLRLGIILITTLIVTMASYLLSITVPLTSYLHLLFASGIISISYIGIVYFWGLTNAEKQLLSKFILRA